MILRLCVVLYVLHTTPKAITTWKTRPVQDGRGAKVSKAGKEGYIFPKKQNKIIINTKRTLPSSLTFTSLCHHSFCTTFFSSKSAYVVAQALKSRDQESDGKKDNNLLLPVFCSPQSTHSLLGIRNKNVRLFCIRQNSKCHFSSSCLAAFQSSLISVNGVVLKCNNVIVR